MTFLWMLIIGLIVGGLAKLVIPGKDPGGLVITMLIGMAGSVLAGFLGRSLGWYGAGEGAGFVAAVVGAIVLLLAYKFIVRGRAS